MYIAKNFNHPNMTKTFKLLNWFDFEHFCETGYPAIGLEYETFPKGPVPKALWLEVKDGKVPEDFKKFIGIHIEHYSDDNQDNAEYLFRAKTKIDMTVFTKREKDILERLKLQFKTCTATMMSDISHEKNRPWYITKERYGLNKPIDYLLALGKPHCIQKEIAQETLNEHLEMLNNFHLKPT